MGVFDRLERGLERAVKQPFARVFKAEVSEMKEEDRQREAEKSARESGTVESTTTEGRTADDAKPRTDNESGPVA